MHAVRGERPGGDGLGVGKLLRLSVDRRRRGEDEALVRPLPGRLEQVLGGEHVVAQVGLEAAAPARPDAGLGGEVEHDVAFVDEIVEIAAARSIGTNSNDVPLARALAGCGASARAAVVVVEAVDADDRRAPSASSDSVRCEPMKPAQPVTSARSTAVLLLDVQRVGIGVEPVAALAGAGPERDLELLRHRARTSAAARSYSAEGADVVPLGVGRVGGDPLAGLEQPEHELGELARALPAGAAARARS